MQPTQRQPHARTNQNAAALLAETSELGLDHVLLCHYAESKPESKKYLFMEELGEEIYQQAADKFSASSGI